MKNLHYPGTLEALALEMRGLCAQSTALWSAVPACLRPALLQFMVGRGMSTTDAGEWVVYARDLRRFWAEVYEGKGLPYGVKTTPTPAVFTLSLDGRVLGTVKPATLEIEPFDEQ